MLSPTDLPANPPRVSDIIRHDRPREFRSKSGAILTVPIYVPYSRLLEAHFNYAEDELAYSGDIRGARVYLVRGILQGAAGGGEFHRIRHETVISIEGTVEWTCMDLYGEMTSYTLAPGVGVEMPPFILHTYRGLEDNNGILIFANTLFTHEEKRTHDTFLREQFLEMQQLLKERA
jgi:hypothetical protein